MDLICGIDEAGRGPVIGPMVMAGIDIEKDNLYKLKELGVKDSKKIPVYKRDELFQEIIKVINKHFIIEITPEKIDQALTQENMNLNWIEAEAHAEILNKLNPKKAYIDCPSRNITSFLEYVKKRIKTQTDIIMEHGADEKYLACSAASILAKVKRDQEIKKLIQKYGDFGSGYPSDPKTKEFIKKNHHLPIFRKSWSTWKKVNFDKKQESLTNF
ncbi:MAG: ribonuclease HII [Nanobdellota archaeon]